MKKTEKTGLLLLVLLVAIVATATVTFGDERYPNGTRWDTPNGNYPNGFVGDGRRTVGLSLIGLGVATGSAWASGLGGGLVADWLIDKLESHASKETVTWVEEDGKRKWLRHGSDTSYKKPPDWVGK